MHETSEGARISMPGQIIYWHAQAAENAAKAIKADLELGGDAESRKAEAIEQTWTALTKSEGSMIAHQGTKKIVQRNLNDPICWIENVLHEPVSVF